MKLKKIEVKNFRKIQSKCSLSINQQTIIVGKNNTSKTSIIEIILKFLSNAIGFKISDFNYKSINRDDINNLYSSYKKGEEVKFPKIEMNVELEISSDDNLAIIKNLIYEFDNNSIIIIKCEYCVDNLEKFFEEYEKYNDKFEKEEDKIDFYNYFEREYSTFYEKKYYSTKPESDYLNSVEANYIYKLFNVFTILAQREVDDTADNDKMTLSNAIWRFYQDKKKKNNNELKDDDIFRDAISYIKDKLDSTYADYFSDLITILNNEIVNDEQKKLDIVSDFDIETLLKKNSKVKYFFDDMQLSESSNGLGYSNLLYIYIQLEAFKFDINSSETPFNIVFIEEPESHLHPQMQSVFLKKINKLFSESNIYSIITTHSSYVLQSSDIKNINYFLSSDSGLSIKSLNDFINDEKYNGLKNVIDKYFVLNTCNLFFADKVIFIEGMAERLLMPYFFEKYDHDFNGNLMEQHISVFEVGGRHAYIFQDLVNFLELKNLTITDIDSVITPHGSKCPCNCTISNIYTTNPTIKKWFVKDEKLLIHDIMEKYISIEQREKTVDSVKSLLSFQTFKNGANYCGRTLEEQIIIENSDILIEKKSKIDSLKTAINSLKEDYYGNKINTNIDSITSDDLKKYCFEIVLNLEKSDFALDLISFNDWNIPEYIVEGLKWLEK